MMIVANKTPFWCEMLLRQFGVNIHGQLNYRVMWSEDCFEWSFGKQVRVYGDGFNRWVLEKWCPPEKYGTSEAWEIKDWETGELIMGPFPREGLYEHVWTCEDQGEFVPLVPSLMVLVCKLIEAGKMETRSKRWAAIKEKQEKHKRDWKQKFDDIVNQRLKVNENEREWFGPGTTGKKSRTSADVKFDKTTADLPAWLPQRAGVSQIHPEEE